jgi:hypothetical protein
MKVGKAWVVFDYDNSRGHMVKVYEDERCTYRVTRLVEHGIPLAQCNVHTDLVRIFDRETADQIIALAIMRGIPP